MKRTLLLSLAVAGMALMTARPVAAHCEVPCGIYTDQVRFEQMLEDTATIAKAITSIRDITAELEAGPEAQSINQVTRWVNTKDSHATNTQHIIAQYFMTQRIKADGDNYVKKLTAAHAVMVAAMKCKQAADPATAETLRKAILDFYRAYEGKEPELHSR
jgi:nickel superoxide dismutase